ncbi:MAG: 5-formyltetrahydrofolate cyclo-ligase [Acidimicrobiales bacterium]|nr:5-formyltetrahydrofolate cyclo-ligase [Acidimicrobiales bacterium]
MASGPLSKAEWRAEAKIRRASNLPQRDELDRALCAKVRDWLLEETPGETLRWVVTYRAFHDEPNLAAIVDDPLLAEAGVRFAITRTPEVGNDLTLHPSSSALERHPYGYDQPVADAPQIGDDQVAVVLVPGLGFDRFGNRLGFGAGYYDRLLGRLDCDVRVGITDAIMDTRLPTDSHDIAMTLIATPNDGVQPVTSDKRRVRSEGAE